MPGGDARLAAGIALRRYAEVDSPDAGLANGDLLGFGFPSASDTAQSSSEQFAELYLPLIKDVPFVRALNVTVGGRRSSYSLIAGDTYSYKAEGDWEPFLGLRFRGGYQHAIRVPTANTLVAGTQQNSLTLISPSATSTSGDPCDVRSSFRLGANASSVRALCVAQGVPASIVDVYNQGGVVTNLVGGNPRLQPETANTYSFGAVLQPRLGDFFVRNLQLTVDYYNIAIKGAFGSIGAAASLAGCYNVGGLNPGYALANPYCASITRDSGTGNVSVIRSFTQNLGGVDTSGIDAQLSGTVPLGSERLSFTAYVTRLLTQRVQATTADPFFSYLGTIAAGPGAAYPKWKVYVTPTIGNDDRSLSLSWRYIDAMRDASLVGAPATATAVGVPAVSYFDLQANVRVSPAFQLRFVVNNLTDKQPPFYTSFAQFYTDPSTYDTLGRRFTVGLTSRF